MRILFFLLFNAAIFPSLVLSQTGPAGVGLTSESDYVELWMDADHITSGDTSISDNTIGMVLRSITEKSGKKYQLQLSDDNVNTIVFANSKQANGLKRIGFNRNMLNQVATGIVIDSFYKASDFTAYIVLDPGPLSKSKETQTIMSYSDLLDTSGLVNNNGILHNFSLEINDNQFTWNAISGSNEESFNVSLPFVSERPYILRLESLAANGLIEMANNDGSVKRNITSKEIYKGFVKFSIGFANGKSPYKGYIYDVIIFSRALNFTERILIENSLSARYNIPLNSMDIYTNDNSENGDYDFEVAGIGKANDGSIISDARGEGIIEIRNPSHLNTNEFLVWGRNGVLLDSINSIDIPAGLSYRLGTTWRCSEIGETGMVDVLMDTSEFRIPQNFKMVMLIDKNQSGQFIDDTVMIFQQGNLSKQRTLSQIQLNNGDRFTLGVIRDMSQWTSGQMTPNGDGSDDTYYVQRRGMVRIMNQNGNLVRELKAPAPWDGRNNDGQLVSPGTYILEINRQERINISVRY